MTRAVRLLLFLACCLVLVPAGPRAAAQGSGGCVLLPCRAFLPLVGAGMAGGVPEAAPDDLPWEHLGMHDRVTDLAFDAAGNLWAATLGGLTQWPASGRARVLVHRPVSRVAVDGEGAVWYGGPAAVGQLVDASSDWLERRAPDGSRRRFGAADGLPQGSLQALAVDGAGRLFAAWGPSGEAPSGGLARWDGAGRWKVWPAEDFGGRPPWALCPDGQGGLWLAGGPVVGGALTPEGAWLRRLDAQGRLQPFETLPPGLAEFAPIRLAAGRGGRLYAILAPRPDATSEPGAVQSGPPFSNDLTVFVTRAANGDWDQIDLPQGLVEDALTQLQGSSPGIQDLAVDEDGTVWLVLYGAVLVLSPDGRTAVLPKARTPIGRPPSAAVKRLHRLLLDPVALALRPGGGLAVAAPGQPGAALLDSAGEAAQAWLSLPDALPGRIARLTSAAGGMVAAGHDLEADRLWLRKAGAQDWEPIDGRDASTQLGYGAIARGPSGELWIADGEWLMQVGPDRRRISHAGPDTGLAGGAVRSLAMGTDGALWVGTEKGLSRRSAGGAWSRWPMPVTASEHVADIAPAPDGGVWLALAASEVDGQFVEGGLLYRGADSQSRQWSSSQMGDEGGGGMDRVLLTAGGQVFVQGDLALFHGDGKGPWRRLDFTPEGGPMALDGEGRLWAFSGFSGLVRFEPEGDGFKAVAASGPGMDTLIFTDLAFEPDGDTLWATAVDLADDAAYLLQRSVDGSWRRIPWSAVQGGQMARDLPLGLALAPDGRIFVTSTADRLLVYGPDASGAWELQGRLTLGGDPAGAACADPAQALWLPYRDGLSSFNSRADWRHVRSIDGLPPLWERGRAFCDPDGRVFVTQPASDGASAKLLAWQASEDRPAAVDAGLVAAVGAGEGVQLLAWSAKGRAAALLSAGGRDDGQVRALLVTQADGAYLRLGAGPLALAMATDLSWGPDDRLWIATDRGLALLDPSVAAAEPGWVADPAVSGRAIRDLAWQGGSLWAVGEGGAALRLRDGSWWLHTKADGLVSEDLVQAAVGPSGDLWLLNAEGSVDRLRR